MNEMNLLPVGNTGGVALPAAAGAFFGSWFGNSWNGNGVGRAAGVAADTVVLDNLNTMQSGINNLGLQLVQGQGQANVVAAQGFGGLNTTILQGDAAVTAAVTSGNANVQNTLAQGFSGLNTSVYQAGVDTRFAINDLARQNAECCCEIKTAIGAEGAATRQLIQNNLIAELQTQLCDAKSKNAQLENQVFFQNSQAAQTQQIISTVIAHLSPKS